MADYSTTDYHILSLASICRVKCLASDGTLELNENLCRVIITRELQVTEDFLQQNKHELRGCHDVHDSRRVTLLQLYSVVKQAESLVQQCCERKDSLWPERALTLFAIKEDVLDILLHLRWWTSILNIVIGSSTITVSPPLDVSKLLKRANQEFEEMLDIMTLLDIMASSSDELQRTATLKNKKRTLDKIVELHGSYPGEVGTKEHLTYILSWNQRNQVARGHMELGRGTTRQLADRDFKDILTNCIELQNAAIEDRTHLLNKALELIRSYSGEPRPREHRAYLLANQVHCLLTDAEINEIPELNVFESKCVIGRGATGVVHQGKWCGFDCVLKQIFNDPRKVEDQNEAKSLKRFSHPHIVKFYRHWVAVPGENRQLSAQSHIAMEQMPVDLAQHMSNLTQNTPSSSSCRVGEKRKSEETPTLVVPFSEPVAIDVMLQLAKAMWHMHSKDVVHRDLKPHNVLLKSVSQEEVPELFGLGYVQVKLGDFGLVRENTLSNHSQLYMSQFAGTTLYRAPELSSLEYVQAGDQKRVVKIEYPHTVDLWSFGVMSAEIVSGVLPFGEDQRRNDLLEDIKKGKRPFIPKDCADYLKFCIENCWKYEPLERPRFSDIWRMLRIAKLRSLGLIRQNYDSFRFIDRNYHVVDLDATVQKSPIKEFGEQSRTSASPRLRSGRERPPNSPARSPSSPGKGTLSFLMSIIQNLKLFGKPKLTRNNGLSIHTKSRHEQPFGYLTNRVWPQESTSDWELDVILFEGNVGGRKTLSCRDTWLQREDPDVFWPKDWLHEDVHRDIRVLVLEYSISDTGLEGIVGDLKQLLIFRDRYNQKHTWQRPIVLVGHSLGCTVIEALVVDLDRNAQQLSTSSISDLDKRKAETSRAFINSLAGCFFYAPPSRALIRRDPILLKEVFGGLDYSDELFRDFWEEPSNLKKLSEDFITLAESHQIRIKALTEGDHTRGRFVVLEEARQGPRFEHCLMLKDSNHIEVCKPVNRQHASYQELVKFLNE